MPAEGQFNASGIAAKLLIMVAYDVQENEIAGGPDWLSTEKWEIAAKTDDGLHHSTEETRLMLQKMLEQRFGLRIRHEIEQRPVYVLTIAKGGPKFRAVQELRPSNVRVSRHSISLESAPLARMTQLLSTALSRPVVDRTGLPGAYDLSLEWDDAPSPEGVPGVDVPAPPGQDHGSIFSAIKDQLGLQLDSAKLPVEVTVIDRIDKPSAN